MIAANKFLPLILATVVVALRANAVPGFSTVDNATLPKPVVEASKSVYKFTAQGGRINRIVHLGNQTEAKSADMDFTKEDLWWQQMQWQYCKRVSDKVCPVFDQLGDGSAFILNQGNQLYTNLHNVFETLSARTSQVSDSSRNSLRSALIGSKLFFGLSDGQKAVLDPTNEIAGTLSFFNPDRGLLQGQTTIMNTPLGRVSDVVRFSLQKTLGTPLKFAKSPPAIGETLYLIGFPSETNDRKAVGAEDSDGKSLRISKGQVITLEDWKTRTGNNFGPVADTLLSQKMIFVDGDCEHGNSGGPLVNANGEVVGIFMALYKDLTKLPQGRICGALNTVNETELNILWNSFAN